MGSQAAHCCRCMRRRFALELVVLLMSCSLLEAEPRMRTLATSTTRTASFCFSSMAAPPTPLPLRGGLPPLRRCGRAALLPLPAARRALLPLPAARREMICRSTPFGIRASLKAAKEGSGGGGGGSSEGSGGLVSTMAEGEEYELVPAGSSGTWTVRALTWDSEEVAETFHPHVGVVAEGKSLYVEQLRMRERCKDPRSGPGGEYVVWDVGLGAAGNAIVALEALDEAGCKNARMVSFDRTLGALRFALQHSEALGYTKGWEGALADLSERGEAIINMPGGCHVVWECRTGDFPTLLSSASPGTLAAAPDCVMYDAFSPARCPEMWTIEALSRLYKHLGGGPCLLSTSSRSTIVRTTLLLSGFYVGKGTPTGGTAYSAKEETTTAATELGLLDVPLVGGKGGWLERVGRSSAAEPLRGEGYTREPATESTLEELNGHPQFRLEG